MTIMVGKGDRFSSKGKPPQPAPVATLQQVAKPPPPDAFRGLQVGPEAGMEWEAPTALTVDGSRPDLRLLSPFVFRVEPPLILGEVSGDQAGKSKVNPGDLFSSVATASEGFGHARSALGSASYAQNDFEYGATAQQALVLGNSLGLTADKNPSVSVPLNGKGEPGRIGIPAIADVWTALDIATQLKATLATPPLVLLINPTSLSKSFSKLQQYTERTRFGYVFQAWGEEQPTLSISARCGAFISGRRGVQWAARRDSAAWQNLVTAFHFYRNNGYIYDTVGKSNAHLMVGALSIHYDGWIYYGHMSSFTYAFNEQNTKGGVEFSMDFTVSAMVDTSKQTTLISPMVPPNPNPKSARFARKGGLSIDLFTGDVKPVTSSAVSPAGGTTSEDFGPSLQTQKGPGLQSAPATPPVVVAAAKPKRGTKAFLPATNTPAKVPKGGNAVPFRRGHA